MVNQVTLCPITPLQFRVRQKKVNEIFRHAGKCLKFNYLDEGPFHYLEKYISIKEDKIKYMLV